MRLLIIIAGIEDSQGGPAAGTLALCKALSYLGIKVTLYTLEPRSAFHAPEGLDLEVVFFPRSWPGRYSNSRSLIGKLKETVRKFDLVHIRGLWNLVSSRSALVCAQVRKPYVITPHGMLSAWNRSFFSVKELYFRLFERRVLENASFVHYVSTAEEQASSVHIRKVPSGVIPNGFWEADLYNADPVGFRRRFGLDCSPFVISVGRLHPIKRLDLQCEAFVVLSGKFPDLKWVFAGPDEGMRKWIERFSERHGLGERIILTGLLRGAEKASALAAASVYCQTSDHEGHSLAIVEALAAGKPCVITAGCNFGALAAAHAGIEVKANPNEIASAIEVLLSKGGVAEQMSRNAASLAKSRYTWEAIAVEMNRVYEKAI